MVKTANLARDSHGKNIDLTSVSDTYRSHDFLLAHINRTLGAHGETFLRSLEEVLLLNFGDESWASLIEMIDTNGVISSSSCEQNLVRHIVVEVGDTRSFTKRTHDKRSIQVPNIPSSILSFGARIES